MSMGWDGNFAGQVREREGAQATYRHRRLPYANGPLHIGHVAGAFLPADICVRNLRQRGTGKCSSSVAATSMARPSPSRR